MGQARRRGTVEQRECEALTKGPLDGEIFVYLFDVLVWAAVGNGAAVLVDNELHIKKTRDVVLLSEGELHIGLRAVANEQVAMRALKINGVVAEAPILRMNAYLSRLELVLSAMREGLPDSLVRTEEGVNVISRSVLIAFSQAKILARPGEVGRRFLVFDFDDVAARLKDIEEFGGADDHGE